MKKQENLTATREILGNDIFWRVTTPIVYKRYRGATKIVGMESLRWTGYNDDFWWREVSKQEGYDTRTDKLGNAWKIDFRTNLVSFAGKIKKSYETNTRKTCTDPTFG